MNKQNLQFDATTDPPDETSARQAGLSHYAYAYDEDGNITRTQTVTWQRHHGQLPGRRAMDGEGSSGGRR